MLSMKTLRVAIVAMGSALLLGSGSTFAVTQQLDGMKAEEIGTLMYASETVPTMQGSTRSTYTQPPATMPTHYQLMSPVPAGKMAGEQVLRFGVSRRIDKDTAIYVRLDLGGGAVFATGAMPALASTSFDADGMEYIQTPQQAYESRISGGAPGENFVVFSTTAALAIGDNLKIDVGDMLAVPAGPGTYTATVSSYAGPDDAVDMVGATGAVSASATIISVKSGIKAEVKAGTTAVADVGTSFMKFKGGMTTANMTTADLGTAMADRDGMALNADTGAPIVTTDVIPAGSLTLSVSGDFSVGVFGLAMRSAAVVADPDATPPVVGMPAVEPCPAMGTAAAPAKGTLTPTEAMPGMASLAGQSAGTYTLCVQTAVMGDNMMPIPEASYMGTITKGMGDDAMQLASGPIGMIKRNGTSVNIGYLTTSEKYNQRLIIVNRGPIAANYELGEFATEEGVMAEAGDMASGMVAADSQIVIPVSNMLTLTSADGRRMRASAVLSLNAAALNVQVATTQVNLEDGGTDTVVYASEGGTIEGI